MIENRVHPDRRHPARGFTLTELLVAMGVIAVLATLTTVAVRAVARDVRLSSGVNTVTAVLDNARALAMRHNKIVLVVFRPKLISEKRQVVEAVLAEWTGESYVNPNVGVIDRFRPIESTPGQPYVRELPENIKVAGPRYGESFGQNVDDYWATQAHLPAINQESPIGPPNEWPGEIVGVMYAPDGTTLSRNAKSDSNRSWVDFVLDPTAAFHAIRSRGVDYDPTNNAVDNSFFEQRLADDEPFVNISPFLVVFDDGEARENRTNDWTTVEGYEQDLIGPLGYIGTSGKRIHFNRYTGVVMTTEDQR